MEPHAAAVRDAWDAVSPDWDERAEELASFTAPVRAALVAALDPRPDDRVLELAGGTGGLGRELAPRVRELVCTDVASGMVAAAERRARAAGLGNVTCEVADAHALGYDAASFDAVVCQCGLMLMPDPDAALREARRVCRPGARFAAATWGPPQDNLWILMIGAALLQHGHTVQGDPTRPGGIFSLAEAEELERRTTAAGFHDVEVTTVDVVETFARFEDYWDLHTATGAPLRATIAGLTQDEVDDVRETCRAACAGFRTDDGYRFTGRALVVTGRV